MLCGNTDLLDKLAEQKDYATICGAAPSEILGLIAFRNQDKLLTANRALCIDNLRALVRFCERVGEGWFLRPKFGTDSMGKEILPPMCTFFLALGKRAVEKYGTAE